MKLSEKRFDMAERLARRFELPEDAVSGAPRITLSGRTRVLVEGHRGLLEYAPDRIAAAGVNCRVLVKGEALTLEAMDRRALVVTGGIWAVELE